MYILLFLKIYNLTTCFLMYHTCIKFKKKFVIYFFQIIPDPIKKKEYFDRLIEL